MMEQNNIVNHRQFAPEGRMVAFTPEVLQKVRQLIQRYPEGQQVGLHDIASKYAHQGPFRNFIFGPRKSRAAKIFLRSASVCRMEAKANRSRQAS